MLHRSPASSLADVIDIILDKGLVIDAYVRVSLVGIELLTIDARIVIASVDTYLRFAEATNRLDLGSAQGRDFPERRGHYPGCGRGRFQGQGEGRSRRHRGKDGEALGSGDDGEDEDASRERSARRRGESR